MAWIDARIPVRFGLAEHATAEDAVLPESAFRAEGHPVGCACCTPRSQAAIVLTRLFLRRAQGSVPFFRRVLIVATSRETKETVRVAVASDPVASARFRIENCFTRR